MIEIKKWFLNKTLTQNERYMFNNGNSDIIAETEKAVKILVISEYGKFSFWCPVSCLELGIDEEEFKAEYESSKERTINHHKFGKGTIIGENKQFNMYKIQFDCGIKELSKVFVDTKR